ncbi:MAG: 5-methyltetrahydropteroyltriglutamate--homocysteine S-methyltransferase [Betaproteobacteria bacterium]|nr:5-methyltetrahydropteroyltriglutamate--homocysteine S-methyltransferase [Betaproteobacteria bacterium]
MTLRTQAPFRADHVGSFLRPRSLLGVRAQYKEGKITKEALRQEEDSAISEIVRFQEDLGFQGITDGEFRRTYFHIDFLEQLAGVETKGGIAVSFRSSAGTVNFSPPVMHVTGKIRHANPIQLADFQYLKSTTALTPKVTIPSPTMLHFRGGRNAISKEAYPDLDAFYADVAGAYRSELKSLADAGCRYIQMDDTNLAYLCDEKMRAGARQRGDDPDELPRRYARLINAAISERPKDMIVCMHLCRGNFKSGWAAEGGYEPVAQVLLSEMNIDGYFLEYDDARSGDFSPLRFLPKNKFVVLGLVSTKLGNLESKDAIKRRIDEAARFAPLENLCLSPQCGFSSTVHGNDIEAEEQRAKLQLVVDTAREVWGLN